MSVHDVSVGTELPQFRQKEGFFVVLSHLVVSFPYSAAFVHSGAFDGRYFNRPNATRKPPYLCQIKPMFRVMVFAGIGVLVIGLALIALGVTAIEYPQVAFRIRHLSGGPQEDALTAAGERNERRLGYLWIGLGLLTCVAGLAGIF